MGRGRQKAKQTKVARELKYFSPETDYERLQRELNGERATRSRHSDSEDDSYEDDYEDRWADGD